MLTCVCGSVLISNGEDWLCPYENDQNYHPKKPIRIPDKRMTTITGIAFNKGRTPGQLIKG